MARWWWLEVRRRCEDGREAMWKMLARLSDSLHVLEKRKSKVLARVSGLPVERLRARPAAGSWSRLEVLDHVVRTEESIVAEARKNLPLRVAVTERMKPRIVLLVMRLPTRIKVPAGVEFVIPDSAVELEGVLGRWDRARTELRDYLEQIEPDRSRLGCFEHPVGGWMDVPLMMGFLASHLRHHEYQLARLKAI